MEDRLLTLLESVIGISKKTSGNNYAFYSPFVDHYKPKLEINIELNAEGNNPWHCWISDEKGKTINSLLRKLKVSKDVWDEHNSIFNKKYKYQSSKSGANGESEVVTLPSEYQPLWKSSTSIYRKHALSYLERRGVSPTDIIKYNIGYCEDGVYKHKIIVPSFDSNSRLNYFVGRSFYESAYKHKNPQVSKDVVGFGLFINWDLPIVICEGVFDAIAIRMNAIPLFGKSPQSELLKQIISNGVKEIYIALDADAFTNALRFAENLMNEGVCVYIIELNDSDPSEMGFDDFYKLMKNTKELTLMKLMEYKLVGV
jgi:DNA primase